MITDDHVEKLLLHWATEHARTMSAYYRWHLNQGGVAAVHVVDRSRERNVRTVTLSKRGTARVARRLIADQLRREREQLPAEQQQIAPLPDWAGGEPIRCKESRGGGEPSWPLDPIAEQVDRWVISLWRWDPRAALALYSVYRLHLKPGEGARWVAQATQLRVDRHGYAAAIARGRLAVRRAAGEQMKLAS